MTAELASPVRPDELQVQGRAMRATIAVFVVVPFCALLAAMLTVTLVATLASAALWQQWRERRSAVLLPAGG